MPMRKLISKKSSRTIRSFIHVRSEYATDTNALVLRLEKRKLPASVREIFEHIESGKVQLTIPLMVSIEVGYLSEGGRIETTVDGVRDYQRMHQTVSFLPITEEVVENAYRIDDIPELHDRLIAGTAKLLNQELLSNDPIRAASKHVVTKWK
jgi:predicted nucleic acid-binding protein